MGGGGGGNRQTDREGGEEGERNIMRQTERGKERQGSLVDGLWPLTTGTVLELCFINATVTLLTHREVPRDRLAQSFSRGPEFSLFLFTLTPFAPFSLNGNL